MNLYDEDKNDQIDIYEIHNLMSSLTRDYERFKPIKDIKKPDMINTVYKFVNESIKMKMENGNLKNDQLNENINSKIESDDRDCQIINS